MYDPMNILLSLFILNWIAVSWMQFIVIFVRISCLSVFVNFYAFEFPYTNLFLGSER
jgi:hypothetical protein